MRISSFFLTLIFAFSFISISFAQTAPQNAETSTTPSSVLQDSDPFKKATDKQISEAQKFYVSCTENEVMSEQKDCRCAATEFLETRIALGDDVSVRDILQVNINQCLKNPENALTAKDIETAKKISEAQKEEAQYVYNECKNSPKLSKNYICECRAASFLEARIKAGPLRDQGMLLIGLKDTCKNTVQRTGGEYSDCMSRGTTIVDIGDIELKDFCECYAKEWVKLYEKAPDLNPRVEQRMLINASVMCSRPNMYE